jgi:chromosomal replication initiation ATPase DnaA
MTSFPIAGLSASAAAAAFGAAFEDLLSPARGSRSVAKARQFAVYLHHVAFGVSLSDCARSFDRDRATVRHACARIEDLRDDAAFDHATTLLEGALVAHRNMVRRLLAGDAA